MYTQLRLAREAEDLRVTTQKILVVICPDSAPLWWASVTIRSPQKCTVYVATFISAHCRNLEKALGIPVPFPTSCTAAFSQSLQPALAPVLPQPLLCLSLPCVAKCAGA